jgi:hypothetical protein
MSPLRNGFFLAKWTMIFRCCLALALAALVKSGLLTTAFCLPEWAVGKTECEANPEQVNLVLKSEKKVKFDNIRVDLGDFGKYQK